MPVKLKRIGSSYDAYIDSAKVGEVYRNLGVGPRWRFVSPAGATLEADSLRALRADIEQAIAGM